MTEAIFEVFSLAYLPSDKSRYKGTNSTTTDQEIFQWVSGIIFLSLNHFDLL